MTLEPKSTLKVLHANDSGGSHERMGYTLPKLIYSVIAMLEIANSKKEIHKINPMAFIIMTSVRDIKSGMIKKRQFK